MIADDVMLSCRGLSKRFGAQSVLAGVDLDVVRGETLVVLGHSGTGKSVLIKHMNVLMRPDSGEVVFEGRDVCGLGERDLVAVRLKVAMLFQAGALFDSLTVGGNVGFPLDQHGVGTPAERDERVAELLDIVGLGGTQEKMPSELSGGMRKRAALARALAIQPEVMLYDEPTTGLDPVTGQQINELIRDMQARFGLTSVVVTHDLASARYIADRMAFLHEGRIRLIGATEEVAATDDPVVGAFFSAGHAGGA